MGVGLKAVRQSSGNLDVGMVVLAFDQRSCEEVTAAVEVNVRVEQEILVVKQGILVDVNHTTEGEDVQGIEGEIQPG
jgi:hypothetical protein